MARRESAGRGSRQATAAGAVDRNARASRIMFMLIPLGLMVLVIVGQLINLTVISGPANSAESASTRTVQIDLSPRRGTIYDCNGIVLATSVDATTVYCNPYEVTDITGTASRVAATLGGTAADYIDALSSPNTSFAYLQRKADVDTAQRLKDLNLSGVYFLADSKRVYPCNQTAGQIVGMVDVDDKGQSGLELYYDDILSGTPGRLVAERGAKDYPIVGGIHEEQKAVDGQDIILSVDVEMQEYMETRVSQAVDELEGSSGEAILYHASTGEIVGMCSTPYLNPSDRNNVEAGATELKPISYPYEPGSIFKTATVMAVLEAGTMTPDTAIDCPSYLEADGYTLSDAHDRAATVYSLREVLQYSSNVGISLAASSLGFQPLYDHLVDYGLTETTGVDYPGESAGYSTDPSNWSLIQSYNVSFGQGISVTPLQITRFYGSILNGGVECTPHFATSMPQSESDLSHDTRQAIRNTDRIPQCISMMQSVVSDGTGTKAQIDGFAPAGKTGTAEYADENGKYIIGMYNISFVGFLPDSNSDLVCFVSVNGVPGDRSTAPAFRDIMNHAISRYRITAK